MADTWVIDLDGVIWLAGEPIAGSSEAVARLRAAGIGVLFATNNALPTGAALRAQLAAVGIEASADEIVSSAQAAASLLPSGSTAVVCAGGGVLEALADRGVTVVAEGPADAVVVALTRAFNYEMLATAVTAVHQGARLVGTNEDATYPTPGRLLPGAGAILAAVATASGVTPEVAGKPHEAIVALIGQRAPEATLVVGDRPSTDGLLATRLGLPFALVRSGVTPPTDPAPDPPPAVDAPDFAAVVNRHLR
jgi:4-nitrophenyl phosphatase